MTTHTATVRQSADNNDNDDKTGIDGTGGGGGDAAEETARAQWGPGARGRHRRRRPAGRCWPPEGSRWPPVC